MPNNIVIKGARVHNLKNIDVEIPRGKLTVITGLSGSGKSSLAFDTIYAEGQRRYMESLSSYASQFLEILEKPDVDFIEGLSPTIAIDQKSAIRTPRSTVGTMSDIYDYLRLIFAKIGRPQCPTCLEGMRWEEIIINDEGGVKIKPVAKKLYVCYGCDTTLPEITLSSFSFNSPHGACPTCQGLGKKSVIEPSLVIPNLRLTLAEGAIRPWSRTTSHSVWYNKVITELAEKYHFSINSPIGKLKKEIINIILHGDEQKTFEGVIPYLEKKYRQTDSDYIKKEIQRYMVEKICPTCAGQRLRPEVLGIKIDGKNIVEVTKLSISELEFFFEKLKIGEFEKKIAAPIMREIQRRLKFLDEVGLGYLTLDRSADTLAGGEAQRIRLASQLGSALTGVVYILDEPSIGLHQRDQGKLMKLLFELRDLGNTVIVVEHDRSTILAADHVIDIGPGAGENGGKIVSQGKPESILKSASSLTGQYLAGKKQIALPSKRRKQNRGFITVNGAKEFNLKNIDVRIPLNNFVCVTGVSGSGKSTLISDILGKYLAQKFYRAKARPGQFESIVGLENIDKVISVDQSPIGRTPRSNPATYTNLFTHIRDLYSDLPESKEKHFSAGHFSFNVRGGRCEHCRGEGVIKIEMYFLPDIYVTCEDCQGKRYNKNVLAVLYKGKSIADVLEMTVSEAHGFFADISGLANKLRVLDLVGLGYMRLGQSATTLSGGEAQRVKLAAELARHDTGRTLYILDEPTTGLHFEDVNHLLSVLQALVEKGNTVLVIEHNLDVIKTADYIIDLGPEGGAGGGRIVAHGALEEVMKIKESQTGKYLKQLIASSK